MSDQTRIAIVGYGNVGRGVHRAIERNADMALGGIITRNPARVREELGQVGGIPIPIFDATGLNQGPPSEISITTDVAILCGGSATDLPKQGPEFARDFNTVDSFDTHADIPEYFAKMDEAARANGRTAIISAGWDPGTFSRARVEMDAFLPGMTPEFFYGLTKKGGISQGHSDAIRQLPGVADARQYTLAIPEAIERVRAGERPNLEAGDKIWRDCYVVLEEGADPEEVDNAIRSMPNYFDAYRTEVTFISQNALDRDHPGMPHDGLVLAMGETGEGNRAMIEYRNEMASNPEFTGGILVASARACHRLNQAGRYGAYTMLNLSPADLSPHSTKRLLEDFV